MTAKIYVAGISQILRDLTSMTRRVCAVRMFRDQLLAVAESPRVKRDERRDMRK